MLTRIRCYSTLFRIMERFMARNMSYNVHNLLHLSNDVQSFSLLDNFSCFKYENHMQKIENKLHNSGAPLEPFSNRIFEELQLPIRSFKVEQYPIVVYKKNNVIYHLKFKSFKFATNKTDNCAMLCDKSIVFILDIFEEDGVCYVHAKHFLNAKFFLMYHVLLKKLAYL